MVMEMITLWSYVGLVSMKAGDFTNDLQMVCSIQRILLMSKPVLLLKVVLIPDFPHVRTQHMELYHAVNVRVLEPCSLES